MMQRNNKQALEERKGDSQGVGLLLSGFCGVVVRRLTKDGQRLGAEKVIIDWFHQQFVNSFLSSIALKYGS